LLLSRSNECDVLRPQENIQRCSHTLS
jgi:hypothetical protein